MSWVARINGKEVNLDDRWIPAGKGDKHLSDIQLRVYTSPIDGVEELQIGYQRDENYRSKRDGSQRSRRVYQPDATTCEIRGEVHNLVEEQVTRLREAHGVTELEEIRWVGNKKVKKI